MDKHILELNLYKNFKCAADKCISTCCCYWNIDIDEETYKKYKKLDKDFNGLLLENITENNKLISLRKNYCPFLTENQLCRIQLKFGFENLSNTCKNYPKIENEYLNFKTNSRLISCPEVLKKIKNEDFFGNKNLIIEKDAIEDNLNEKAKIDSLLFISFYKKLQYLSKLKISLKKLVNVFYLFSKDFDKFFRVTTTKNLLTNFEQTFNKQYFKNLIKNNVLKKNYFNLYTINNKLLLLSKTFNTKNHLFKQYIEQYKNTPITEETLHKYFKTYSKLYNKCINTKKLFLYLIYQTFVDAYYNKAFHLRVKFAITFIAYANAFCFASFLNDSLRYNNNFLKITSNVFKVLYHGKFSKNLQKSFDIPFFIKTNFFETIISFL